MLGVAEQLWDAYLGSSYEIVTGIMLVLLVAGWRPSGLFNRIAIRNV
jgi:branched-subunit amino acid ABC-type transport system permease component